MRKSRRILTVSPNNEPLWVRLHVQPIGERWVAMVLGDTSPPPGPDEVRGQAFFGDTAEGAEELAKAFLGMSEPVS
jgi:hypothetical protein